ncbi:MAG TPA: hypothetical protein QF695_12180 [Arenicellales bacterium]|jgi:hypothetical protein|nr:hypothetical protein [Pseudomonadales bacterium]MDP6316772.1 hypothetical protein [Pseudomonadales bacterium]MDP7313532.1 hypothetical protein [Pseudomonadales bacterium]HJL53382.1 hypothetical protein [Arenicellales bacterium]|tara:strand:- start:331 stop:573 length:243 start_codon:yes stop_codon:yes gene_type:complete
MYPELPLTSIPDQTDNFIFLSFFFSAIWGFLEFVAGVYLDLTAIPCSDIADVTEPDIIQKIPDHIEAQPPPNQPATIIQS